MPARYFPRLAALATDLAATPADQLPRLRKLLETVLRDEHKRRGASFGNLSQAIGFVVFEHELPARLRHQLQELRLKANLVLHESYPGTAAEVYAGFGAVAELVEHLTGVRYDGPAPPAPTQTPEEEQADFEAALIAQGPTVAPPAAWRVHVLATDLATGALTVELETPADGRPAGPFDVVLPEAYASLLPVAAVLHPTLHLIGPVLLPDGRVQPRRVVLEPDYLISVTTVAECAQKDGTIPEWALINAFLPDETSRPLVLGNMVNMLLDEEVSFAARQEEWKVQQQESTLKAHRARLTAILEGARGLQPAAPAATAEPEAAAAVDAANRFPDFDLEHFLHKRLFRLAPLALSTLPEFQTRTGVPELFDDLRRHHRTLRETQQRGFVADSRSGYQQQRLRVADCFLEPTFLSATYGLQGRLDLLHESPTGYDLIELKSSKSVPGGPPWTNHTAQAQLYRLLLESVFGADGETAGRGRTSILYSNAANGQSAVRRVDQDQQLIDRLLNARNQLVGVELQLARATGPRQTRQLLAPVIRPDLSGLPSFGREKAQHVANAWAAADLVERAYCLELIRFSAREMRLTLLGDEARPGDAGGQAGLWLLPQARKHQNFSLLDELELIEDHSNADDDARDGLGPHLIFQRQPGGREVNFRAGDTLILYPRRKAEGDLGVGDLGTQGLGDLGTQGLGDSGTQGLGDLGTQGLGDLGTQGLGDLDTQNAAPEPQTPGIENSKSPSPQVPKSPPTKSLSPLDSQVVKVVLAEDLGADGRVVLAVRNRRLAPRYLQGHSHWALEPDTYDTFRREWASLSAFLSLAPERRARLLARTGPRPPAPECWTPASPPANTAPEVVARALAAPDWFVLCGPPGTGKTRAVLRELAERLYKDHKHTLLAAYTNRAVDEICEQLVAAGLPFIRVGSRLGTAPHYRPYLLDNMLRDCPTRQAVRERLKNCPFYVGTVASLLGKPELFTLKQFDLAVVDEASQVLEAPMLALLSKVNKFILIGDHRQLPAVVAQEPETSAVAEEVAELLRTELGLTNLRNSYFERLFRRAEAQWPHAHGTLANQYRMHEELADLVNGPFYEGQLRCPLPWQHEPLNRAAWPAPTDVLTQKLHDQRLVFMPTRRQPEDLSMKESAQEADLAARAAAYVVQGYGALYNPETTLGIIASYRNQAALIRARLAALAAELALPQLTQVSVDTVERYQGSQREVIIMSFCCHHEHQLEMMVSPNEDGTVDRKLNVALTRARQQLVLLGNELLLSRAPHHAALLAQMGVEVAE